jgi:hypothetical protein
MEREKTRLRFDRHGGFFIEVAVSPAEGVTMSWGSKSLWQKLAWTP